jgi:DnaJ homolog subfamily B member 4
MGKDYYKILEIPKDCNDECLKKAYRKHAMKWHPDKCQDAGATEKFQEIAEAYEVLSDKEKRAVYDKYGEEGLRAGHGQHGQHGQHGFKCADDIFQQFFSSGFSGMTRQGQAPARTAQNINCTLEELYTGCTKKFRITDKGNTKEIELHIKPGTRKEQAIQSGNCIFSVAEKPHEYFTRKGDDLHYNYTLSLQEYINGFSLIITHLDGKKKKISNAFGSANIGPGAPVMVIPGMGMTKPGKLYIHFIITTPKTL